MRDRDVGDPEAGQLLHVPANLRRIAAELKPAFDGVDQDRDAASEQGVELADRVRDCDLAGVVVDVILDRLTLVDEVAEVARSRWRAVALGQVDLVERLVQHRQRNADFARSHLLLGHARRVSGSLVVGHPGDQLDHPPLPSLPQPDARALVRALLLVHQQMHREVRVQIDQHPKPSTGDHLSATGPKPVGACARTAPPRPLFGVKRLGVRAASPPVGATPTQEDKPRGSRGGTLRRELWPLSPRRRRSRPAGSRARARTGSR